MSTNRMDMNGRSRRIIRYVVAIISLMIAIVYFLIGFNVVSVVDTSTEQVFGLYAGVAYLLGTLLLLAFDRRLLWVLGAFLQIFVIYTYFSLAPQRTPAYEVWGILIRVAQFVVLISLAYLVARSLRTQSTE